MLGIARVFNLDADLARGARHHVFRQRVQGLLQQRFDQSLQKASQRVKKAAQFTAKRSIDFQRIDVD